MNLPKYPVYIPSKDRAKYCYTAKFFLDDNVKFKIVIEPNQVKEYSKYFDKSLFLILPENNMRLLGSRLWIREHSIKNGYARHWQFDDNIRDIRRLHKGKRLPCNANLAIKVIEDFTDRYTNIGVSGFNYYMFVMNHTKKPYYLNTHVYSASLINNKMPFKWRLYYNDDTDLCLQVLHNGLCTVAFNAFMAHKIETMVTKGGNTKDLYQDDGRLKMARTLEQVWPQYVKTVWKFGRPQHEIKNNWQDFKQPLIRRTDINWQEIEKTTYNIKLKKVKDIKSKTLKKFFDENQ